METACHRKNCRRRRHGDAAVWRRRRRAHGGGKLPPPGGGGNAGVHRREQKGTGHRMVSCPLLTPLTFLCAATPFGRAAKRGLRGLGSVRRADFGTLLCPEFSLRYPPRITVRGQTVQGGSVLLRKAPLPSSVCPWSTKRHCGPLAFRRATEGSRVLRRVWGSQEGAREPYGALAPFCPCRWAPTIPPPPGGGIPVPPKAAIPPCRGYGYKTKERFSPLLCRFFAFYAVFSQIGFLLL